MASLPETLIIVNPIAGGGRGAKVWDSMEGILRAWAPAFEIRLTTAPGDAERWAAEWAAGHPNGIVVVVGGDGTVHEAVNGLLPARSSCQLAIIPAGSGNDIARNVGVDPNPAHAAGALREPDRYRRVDAAQCDFQSPGGEARVRYFVNSLSVGVSARANRIAVALRPLITSALRYPLAGVLAVLAQGSSSYQVQANDRILHAGPALNITLANGARFGGGLCIAPGADPGDGALDLVVIGAMGRLRALAALTRLRDGTHTRLDGVATTRVSERVRILGPSGPLGIELDGENLEAQGELWIDPLPGALAILGKPG